MTEQDSTPDGEHRPPSTIPHWHSPDSTTLNIVRGEGPNVFDERGERYLDFASQLICVNAGHSNERIMDAMYDQLRRIPYVAPKLHNDTRSALADRLVEISPDPLTDVYFSISGTDAVEAASHIARRHQDAPKILSRYRSYHGSTAGAMSLTGDPETRTPVERYAPVSNRAFFLPPLSYRSPFDADTPEELAEQAAENVEYVVKNEGPDSIAGLITEPVAGTSGAFTAPPGYFERLREICDEYDILLIADEVMMGFGRCGDWFGMQTEGVDPDILTFAKGVTSSYAPLAGVLLSDEIGDSIRENGINMGQTWGGHPVSCAAGLAAIDEYEDGLIENVRALEPVLESGLNSLLEGHAVVGDVRGRGLHWAIEFTDPGTGEPFFDSRFEDGPNPVMEVLETAAREHQVLFGPGKPAFQIIVSPPFCVDETDIEEAVDALDASIESVFS